MLLALLVLLVPLGRRLRPGRRGAGNGHDCAERDAGGEEAPAAGAWGGQWRAHGRVR